MKAGFALDRIFEPGSEIKAPLNAHLPDLPYHFGALGWKRYCHAF
jgi:hypothetical protein